MTPAGKMKVLVVDDDKIILDFMVRFLTRLNFEVRSVEDGYKAMALAHEEKFDLAFLDMRMPGMNGVETLKALKKINPKTAYIVMTGYAVEDLLQEATKEGAILTLKKPFDIAPLAEFLKEFAGKKSTEDISVVDDDKNIKEPGH